MKVEKVPLTTMESRVEELQTDKAVWQNLRTRISALSNQCASMYNYDNPFAERIVSSSDNAVTATAVRNADLTEHSVRVIQTAAADKLLSSPLSKKTEIPAGHYVFAAGNKNVSYFFNGGNPKSFVDGLNRRAPDFLRAQIVQTTPDEQVILLESKLTGAANALRFEGDAKQLAESIGWISPQAISNTETQKNSVSVAAFTQSNPYQVSHSPDTCLVNPKEIISIPLNTENEQQISLKVKTVDLSQTPAFQANKKPFEMNIIGTASFEDVTLTNEVSLLPENFNQDSVSSNVSPDESIFLTVETPEGDRRIPWPKSPTSNEELSLVLDELNGSAKSLRIENQSDQFALILGEVTVSQAPKNETSQRSANAIETARDAIFEYDGIKLTRPVNQIADVNDQITFTLNAPTSNPVSLKVETNAEAVKDKIIEFAYNYNKLIEDINIYSTRDEKVLDELSYLEPAEREEKEKVLGVLQGDVTLIQTKNRLQQIVNNSYDIQSPDQISMLFQLGIGSNLSAYSGYSASRMRGYLEIDETKLDEAVRNNINDLQKIFGFDTNNDYITDNGIAFLMNEYLTSFSQQGGIIDGKIQTYDRQIAQQERDITNFNDRMEKKEADYKRQFGNMEAMYERLKDSSRALDSLNTNNRNNQ